jgi:t-SNARE complex subunit (syntaxin)
MKKWLKALVLTGVVASTMCVSAADSKEDNSWQQAVAQLTSQVQESNKNNAADLKKAQDNLTEQMTSLQQRVDKEIAGLATQIQQVQGNLNKFIDKYNKAS